MTGAHEQVAAMMARLYPDPVGPRANQEVRQIMEKVNKWNPLLLPEMWPSWLQQHDFTQQAGNLPDDVHLLSVKGPILNRLMQIFGTKMYFALHYELTGQPIPVVGVWQ
jgi:hypothetical protein